MKKPTHSTSLAAQLGICLQRLQAKVTTAESCTGGGVAAAITEVAGSSKWFDRAFITYSEAAKHQLLGVSQQLLRDKTAVSEEVAIAMAEGAQRNASADYAIAVTGLAGPSGDGSGRPIGLVWLAWATPQGTFSQQLQLDGDRTRIRQAAVEAALAGLLDHLPQKTV